MAFAIALAGGGTRGAAHVGVLAGLEEAGLIPEAVAGTSAGGIVAGLYACGLGIPRLKELVQALAQKRIRLVDPDCLGILRAVFQLLTGRPLTLQGLLKGNRLARLLEDCTGGMALREVPMRLAIPAVDIRSGDTVIYTNTLAGIRPLEQTQWRNDRTVGEAMRASAAVPAVFRPLTCRKYCLADGGIADNLPIDVLLAMGYRRILAVDITEEYEPPCRENLIEIASHSLTIMGNRLRACISTGEQYRLCPRLPEDAGLLTFDQMTACMQAGYEAVREQKAVLRSLFGP